MSRPEAVELGPRIGRVLRIGTLLAVAAIGVGFVAALLGDEPQPGPAPLIDVVGRGGADGLIGMGLLALGLIPVVALAVAIPVLARAGERWRAGAAALVLGLLGISLAVAVAIGSAI